MPDVVGIKVGSYVKVIEGEYAGYIARVVDINSQSYLVEFDENEVVTMSGIERFSLHSGGMPNTDMNKWWVESSDIVLAEELPEMPDDIPINYAC